MSKKMCRVLRVSQLLTLLLIKNYYVLGNGNTNHNLEFGAQIENIDSLRSVTRYPFPQFREISPCSCDVTMNKCDVGCCCDPECPKENNNNITCIKGKMTVKSIIRRY